jgi:hypothetical protein
MRAFDDARHLHARRRRVAQGRSNSRRGAIVRRNAPKCSEVGSTARNDSARKRQRELNLGLEAPPGFEPGMEVLQIS